MSDGWIEWAGGDMPVDATAMIQFQFRYEDRATAECRVPYVADWVSWGHKGGDLDIVAYRTVKVVE